MRKKTPHPHGSVTSQRTTGSEFLGRSSNPQVNNVDPEKLATTSSVRPMLQNDEVSLDDYEGLLRALIPR